MFKLYCHWFWPLIILPTSLVSTKQLCKKTCNEKCLNIEEGGFCECESGLNCQVRSLSLFLRMLYFLIAGMLQSDKTDFLSEMGLWWNAVEMLNNMWCVTAWHILKLIFIYLLSLSGPDLNSDLPSLLVYCWLFRVCFNFSIPNSFIFCLSLSFCF